MLQSHITLLLVVGVLATGGALLTGDNMVAILAGLIGAFASGLAAIGLFNVEVVTETGSVAAVGDYPAIALFAAALAATAAWPALTGPIALASEANDRDGLPPLEDL